MSSGSGRYEHGDADRIILDVVTAVAEENGVEPMDLGPLYEAIDPDYLVSFVEDADETARTTFEFGGMDVSVSGDGSVQLRHPPGDE